MVSGVKVRCPVCKRPGLSATKKGKVGVHNDSRGGLPFGTECAGSGQEPLGKTTDN